MITERVFLDTNVLVYFFDEDEPAKQAVAREVVSDLIRTGSAILSTQILQELFVTLTRKLRRPMSPKAAHRVLRRLCDLPIVQVDEGLVLEAADLSGREPVSFWDALVIGAAQKVDCNVLLTEDLQHDRVWGKLAVRNPFRDLHGSLVMEPID